MPYWKSHRRYKNEEITIDIPTADMEKMGEKDSPIHIPGNKLYFYSDVTRDSIYTLVRQIDEMTKNLRILQINYNLSEPPPIQLYISSEGGEVFASLAATDKIANNPIPIYTYCEGIVASAATLLTVVGKKRYITKNSTMLIHQISQNMWGNYQEFKDELQNLDLLMHIIKTIYLQHTKFTDSDLEDLLKRDLCLNPETCLKHGLIDIIV